MRNPIKVAAASVYTVAALASMVPGEIAYRKEQRNRRIQDELYVQMIEQSQIKIGPYVPTPCPVQVWA